MSCSLNAQIRQSLNYRKNMARFVQRSLVIYLTIRKIPKNVNDAYLGTWNTIPPQNPSPLSSYVCRIVRNLAIKKYHTKTAVKRNSIYDVALDELENCFPSSVSVEDEYNAIETARIIDKFLETLDQKNRIMFVRRYWYAYSISELAKQFGLKSNTVSVRLSRIRDKLRDYLKGEGFTV